MLETAVGDGANKLGLEQEIAEASRVDTDVAALLVDVVAGSELGLLGRRSGGLVAADLLVRVVDEILFVRHVERVSSVGGMERGWRICRRLEGGEEKVEGGENATSAVARENPKSQV